MHLLGALVLCAAMLPLIAADQAPIGPRLEVDATEIDLGAIDKGAPAEAKFTLRNTGDQMLKITRAKPG